MKNRFFSLSLVGYLVTVTPCVLSAKQGVEEEIRAEMAKVAQIEKPFFEYTKKARNERLNQLFRKYVQRLGGRVTGATVRQFNIMLKECDLTNFDDFLIAETTPLKYVKDPASGDKVPVLGPLGSDVINPWLAAMEVVQGRPLEEQPMYCLATDALKEHIDFALIGIKDPNLSLALLPPELRRNASWAYSRLNPTNRFDGGFDHPLFYATIREAVKKLFRQDYPEAKLTMADLVVPEAQGGFGIRSCLLCHDRNHSGVYKRLLGQSLMFEAKAADLQDGRGVDSNLASGKLLGDSEQLKQAVANAEMFRLAAERVLDSFPDKIDSQQVRESLATLSRDNLSHLKPGYGDFYATLERIGCMECHSSDSDPPPEKNPAKYGALVLNQSDYYKGKNIRALLSVIDIDDPSNSKLLLKAGAVVNHRGKDIMLLDAEEVEELRAALTKWMHSLKTNQTH